MAQCCRVWRLAFHKRCGSGAGAARVSHTVSWVANRGSTSSAAEIYYSWSLALFTEVVDMCVPHGIRSLSDARGMPSEKCD